MIATSQTTVNDFFDIKANACNFNDIKYHLVRQNYNNI